MANQSEMVIIIRPSFKKVCGPDACRAGVYNHILYRLAKKAKNEPEKDVRDGNIFWFASAEDICQDIDEAWCVNKVRKEIKQLVDAGLLGQRHNPIKKWDRKYQYFLSEEQGEKLLERCTAEGVCLLHIGLNAEVLHLLHMVNAFNKNGGCICQKEEMELPNMGNASTINGGAIPEGSQPKGSAEGSLSEEEEESNSNETPKHTIVSSDTARATSLQDEKMCTDEKPQGDDHATLPASGHSHRVGEPAAPDMGHSHRSGHSAGLEAQEITEGEHHANRVPTLPATDHSASSERAVSRPGSDHSHRTVSPADGLPAVRPARSGTPGQEAGRDTRDTAQTLAQTLTTLRPAQPLSPFPQAEQAALGQSPKGKGKKQAEPKPETPKSPPVEPPADMAWGTRKCLMWFDFWRGGILIGKWKLMQASTCAKGLAEQFDEQTVIQARTDMEADPYYIGKGGCDVCDVANNIHKYLKRRQGKQQPVLKVVKRYSSYDDPNFRSDQDFYPVEGGSYATASV